MSEATRILEALGAGDRHASEALLPLVYDELRKLAAARLADEDTAQTLQPTALVHEAYLRLVGDGAPHWNSRGHFFGAAAEAMRRILVENARRKRSAKHGGQMERVHVEDFDNLDLATQSESETVLRVDEALTRLAERDPTAAELIKLRFFTGLSNVEAAEMLGLSERSAKRTWAYARAWLYEELERSR